MSVPEMNHGLEHTNFGRQLCRPAFALAAAAEFARAGLAALRRRGVARVRLLPEEVRTAREELLRNARPSAIPLEMSPRPAFPGQLRLATCDVAHDGEPDWHSAFEDREDGFVLHRWNWLLTGGMSWDEGVALMRSWLSACGDDRQLAGDAYSTGERIVNGCVFYLLHHGAERQRMPADLRRALQRMAWDVAANLEYHGGEATGNHAFNNARGLFFAGVLLDVPPAIDLAVAIARERLPQLVDSDGFLREGSTQYHFLFLRWVLEMVWLAEATEQWPMWSLLEPIAGGLVRGARFFLVQQPNHGWTMPLIGDISPDFTPGWLTGVPMARVARQFQQTLEVTTFDHGWQALWDTLPPATTVRAGIVAVPSDRERGAVARGDWGRLEWEDFSLFCHHCPGGRRRAHATHRHADLGGFTLMWQGQPLVVDPGRRTYGADDVADFAVSAEAHSTLLVDGLGPEPSIRLARLPAVYRLRDSMIEAGENEHGAWLRLRHDGFTRLGDAAMRHQRTWQATPAGLVIEDELAGEGEHELRWLFQWAPAVKVELPPARGRATVRGGRGAFELEWSEAPHVAAHLQTMAVAFAYGESLDGATLSVSERVTLPVVRRFCLQRKNECVV